MRGIHLFALALLACAACADSGTSTGNPAPIDPDAGRGEPTEDLDNGGVNGSGYCAAGDKTPIELDEATPLGFSAADILAFAEGTHETSIRWNPQPGITLLPESGEQTIAVTVTATGEARMVEPKPPGGDGQQPTDLPAIGSDSGGECVSWLEIDVEVRVETSGGALDETFETVLRAHGPLTTSLYCAPDPNELGGDFHVEVSSSFEGFTLAQLGLNIRFSEYGVSGTFDGFLERRDSDSVSSAAVGEEPFADFGAGSCASSPTGFAIGLDDAIEGATVRDGVDLFNADEELNVLWDDAEPALGALEFAPAEDGGCIVLDGEATGDLVLVAEGTLTLASDDGRLDATWEGRLEAHVAADGTIARVDYRLGEKLPAPTEPDAIAAYGFPNEDFAAGSFDFIGLMVDLTATSTGVAGAVTLTGYMSPDCETPAPMPAPDEPGSSDPSIPNSGSGSAPGCRPDEAVELVRAVID